MFYRTTGSPGSKSPAGGSSGPGAGGGGGGGSGAGGIGEPRTPTAGAQNKQLQNVKGDHPSVRCLISFI